MNHTPSRRADSVPLPAAPEFRALPDLGDATVRGMCALPPTGWYCTRSAGHDGPCAAHQGIGPAGAQGSRASMKRKPDEIRGQFFKQLSATERLKVLRVFLDISDAAAAEVNSHSIEAKLLSVILQPAAPDTARGGAVAAVDDLLYEHARAVMQLREYGHSPDRADNVRTTEDAIRAAVAAGPRPQVLSQANTERDGWTAAAKALYDMRPGDQHAAKPTGSQR